MSGAFQRKWSDDQRDAMTSGRLDRGMTLRRVVELAKAGELTAPDGTKLDPFTPPISTVASLARDEKKRRLGKQTTQLAQLEPRDAIEALRKRLLSAADGVLQVEEKKPPEKRDLDRMREVGRCVREFAAIKAPTDEPSRKPGQRENGKQPEAPTRTGLAGTILNAHRNGEGATASGTHTETEAHAETGDAAQRSAHDAQAAEAQGDDAPGSDARAAVTSALATA